MAMSVLATKFHVPRPRGPAAPRRRPGHLERANLFVVPLDEWRQWYRYHHLWPKYSGPVRRTRNLTLNSRYTGAPVIGTSAMVCWRTP